jgi:hypothetical protein
MLCAQHQINEFEIEWDLEDSSFRMKLPYRMPSVEDWLKGEKNYYTGEYTKLEYCVNGEVKELKDNQTIVIISEHPVRIMKPEIDYSNGSFEVKTLFFNVRAFLHISNSEYKFLNEEEEVSLKGSREDYRIELLEKVGKVNFINHIEADNSQDSFYENFIINLRTKTIYATGSKKYGYIYRQLTESYYIKSIFLHTYDKNGTLIRRKALAEY